MRTNWWAVVGIISTGLLMGWLFRYSLDRFKNYTVRTMGASVSVVLGAAVTYVFGMKGSSQPQVTNEIWLYPVGLLLGVAFTSALKMDEQSSQRNPEGSGGPAANPSLP